MKLTKIVMRSQSNELMRLAKQLRDYIHSIDVKAEKSNYIISMHESGYMTIHVSNNVRVNCNSPRDYMSINLCNWRKTVDIGLFEQSGYSNNTITINTELVDDVELEANHFVI